MKKYINKIISFLLKHILFIIWAVLSVFLYYYSSQVLEQYEIRELKSSEEEFTSKENTFFKDNNMIGCMEKRYFNPSKHELNDSITMNGITLYYKVDYTLKDTTEKFFMFIRESIHNVVCTELSIDELKDLKMIDYEKQSRSDQVSAAMYKLHSNFKLVNDKNDLEQSFHNIRSKFHEWAPIDFSQDSIEVRITLGKENNDSVPYYSINSHPQKAYVVILDQGKVIKYFACISLFALMISMAIALAVTKIIKKYCYSPKS